MPTAPVPALNQPETPRSSPRSQESLKFEAFWRSLPADRCIPHQRDFRPERLGALLKFVALIEVNLAPPASFRFRLVGNAIREAVQQDIVGRDYLEFLPRELHAGATESGRLMVEHPCGLWQISPVHYRRGFAQHMEITAFPLRAEPAPKLIGVMIPRDVLLEPQGAKDKPLIYETAATFEFIDIGAGSPGWPPVFPKA
jgi:hypothetical protein